LDLGAPKKKEKVEEDAQWVKDLNMNKKETPEEIAFRENLLAEVNANTKEISD